MARSLDDAVIAVVGATGGLGGAVTSELERRGAIVVGASRSGEIRIDVRDAGAGDELVAGVLDRHGRLDGVIIASGVVAFGDLADTEDVIAEELMLVNALGPLWIARRALPALAETNGFFAAITGVVAEAPQPGMAAYSASKASLAAGLAAIRREFRRRNVTVHDIRPPHTETGLADRPIAGTAPKLPTGLDPATVAAAAVDAIEGGRDELPADAIA
jgi:short-subunit dehydrogenase